MTHAAPPYGKRINPTAAFSGTVNMRAFMTASERIAKMLRLSPPKFIMLRITAEEVTILDANQKERANVVLYAERFTGPARMLESPVAREIMRLRGYESILLLSSIERPAKVEPALEKYINDMVLDANQKILQSIHDELLSAGHYPRRAGFEAWFEQTLAWASINDPGQQIIRSLPDGSITIDKLDAVSLDQLRKAFDQAAHTFKHEKALHSPGIVPISHARTDFQDVHQAVHEINVGMIKEMLNKVKPGQNTIYLQVLDPDRGVIAQVHSRETADIALLIQPYKFDLENVSFRVQIRLRKSSVRTSVAFVTAFYLRPAMLKTRAFFEVIVARVNHELDREFRGPIEDSIAPRTDRETLEKDRLPVEAQLAQIRMPAFQIFTWKE